MLPFMRARNSLHTYTITNFGGIDPSYSNKANEPTDAVNMTSRNYPALSSRKRESIVRVSDREICTAGFFNKLYTVEKSAGENTGLYLCTENSETLISDNSIGEGTAGEHTMEFMKDQILLIPENVIYHTKTSSVEKCCVSETTTRESALEKFESESLTTDNMPMPYNTWYSGYITGNSFVSMQANYKKSSSSYTFYHFGLSDEFEAGDIVTLKMEVKAIEVVQDNAYIQYRKKMKNGITVKIKDVVKTNHETPMGRISEITSLIFDDNAIDMGGYDEVFVFDITVEKGIPNFSDICSFENRMWGITNEEIHASKLGDPSIWDDFSADSYGTLPSSCFRTGVESDGVFTAITSYNGNVVAFKEDCFYKIYGNQPEEYRLSRFNFPGVRSGCKKTLAVSGGCLFYMGKGGIYRYNGSSVKLVSSELELSRFEAKCAGADERFYYIILCSDTEEFIFVYDTLYGIWHKINSPQKANSIVCTDSCVICTTENSVTKLESGDWGEWSFVLAFAKREFSSKHIFSLGIRYDLAEGASVTIKLKNKHGTITLAQICEKGKNKLLKLCLSVNCSEDADLIFEGNGEFTLSSLKLNYKETEINN